MKLTLIPQPAVSLLMSALVFFTACGSDDGDNVLSQTGENDKTYAETFTEKLRAGVYDIEMLISDGEHDGVSYRIAACVPDDGSEEGIYFVSMESEGVYSEFYTTGGATYMLFPEIKCYSLSEGGSYMTEMFELDEGDTLSSAETADGRVAETYTFEDELGDKEVCTFVFDKETGDPIEFYGDEDDGVYIAFTSVLWECSDIGLPSFDGWTDISDEDSLTPADEIKISLYFYGIAENELAEKGYSYDELAELDGEELAEVYKELGATEE